MGLGRRVDAVHRHPGRAGERMADRPQGARDDPLADLALERIDDLRRAVGRDRHQPVHVVQPGVHPVGLGREVATRRPAPTPARSSPSASPAARSTTSGRRAPAGRTTAGRRRGGRRPDRHPARGAGPLLAGEQGIEALAVQIGHPHLVAAPAGSRRSARSATAIVNDSGSGWQVHDQRVHPAASPDGPSCARPGRGTRRGRPRRACRWSTARARSSGCASPQFIRRARVSIRRPPSWSSLT